MAMSAKWPSTSCCSVSSWPNFCTASPRHMSATFLAPATIAVSAARNASSSARGGGPGGDLVHERVGLVEHRQLALHRAADEPAGDQQPVDLVGALEDAVDAGVAPVALGGVVLDVAGAPEDLHRLVHAVVEDLGGVDLHHRALDVVLLDAPQGVRAVVRPRPRPGCGRSCPRCGTRSTPRRRRGSPSPRACASRGRSR